MRSLSLVWWLSVLLSCVHHPPVAPPRTTEQLVQAALPSVVLLVGVRSDGKTSFGSGIIMSRTGQVLTCLHLVRGMTQLRAMQYEPGLVTYTPMDGGLDRFLFENRSRLVDVSVDRIDEANDLALVRMDADTGTVPLLPLAEDLPRRGEAVLVLGHPQETVWSFTSGVVSALHNGAIQHDAALNPGSSGGPLLNQRGELVGVSSAKVFGDTDGVGFARPIGMARWLLEDDTRSFGLDLSTPEKAASSCIRAQELASPNLEACFDWDHRWLYFENARQSLEGHVDRKALASIASDDRGEWLKQSKSLLRAAVRDGQRSTSSNVLPPLPAALDPLVREARALITSQEQRLKAENHLEVELTDQRAIRKLLRRGVRVEATLRVKPHLAWVLLIGRNLDGTEYRFSEVWAQDGSEKWHQRTPAGEEELRSLPKAFAPPLVLPGEMVARLQLELLGQLFAISGRSAERGEGDHCAAR